MRAGARTDLAPAEERAWPRCSRCTALREGGSGLCAKHEFEREAEEGFRALTGAIETIRDAVIAVHQEILATPRDIEGLDTQFRDRSAA